MTPIHRYIGYLTADLTEGKVHKITEKDGKIRYVVLFPATWETVGPKYKDVTGPATGPEGLKMDVQNYRVLTWEERELFAAPA